jgi:hypothetical protein
MKKRHSHTHSIILSTRGGGSSNSEAAGGDDHDHDNVENSFDVRVSQVAKNTSTSTYNPSAGKIEKSNDAAAESAGVNTSKSIQIPQKIQSFLDDKQGDTFIPSIPTMSTSTETPTTSISNAEKRWDYSAQQQQNYPIPPPPYCTRSTDVDGSPLDVQQPSYGHQMHHQSEQLDHAVTNEKERFSNMHHTPATDFLYQQQLHPIKKEPSSSLLTKVPFQNTHNRNNTILLTTDTTSTTTTTTTTTTASTPITVVPKNAKPTSIQYKRKQLSFDSLQKILFSFLGVSILSCCAVSPRTADFIQFHSKFKENMCIVALVAVPPILFYCLVIFDGREGGTDINSVLSTFYSAFTTGYLLSFLLEIFTTTLIRLAVFRISEPQAFDLVPRVPLPLLPWTLREHKYRPKRITIFTADFLTSCVASALIEEYVKLKVVQWTGVRLPRNFVISDNTNITSSAAGKRGYTRNKKKRMMVPVCDTGFNEQQQQQPQDVTSIRPYVSHMAASSLGLKLADSIRRALMYTKPTDSHKAFYALCRGIFPIHELCGILTALQLAKRDVLGIYMPLFKIIFPAVFVHGMANFRGKKPVFKWSSSTPWLELQMSPWNVASGSTMFQILKKGFAKFMWLSFLGQVLGHCVRNFYMITRQAVNRTSACSAGQKAFSAEIKAAEKGFTKFMWLAILGRVAGYCIQNYYMISHQSAT